MDKPSIDKALQEAFLQKLKEQNYERFSEETVKIFKEVFAAIETLKARAELKNNEIAERAEARIEEFARGFRERLGATNADVGNKASKQELSSLSKSLEGFREELLELVQETRDQMPEPLTGEEIIERVSLIDRQWLPVEVIKGAEKLVSKDQLETAIVEIGGKLTVLEKRNAKGYGALGGGSEGTGSLFLSRLRDVDLSGLSKRDGKYVLGSGGGGGGGAVDSVNGQTGVVVLDADDVGALQAGDNISELVNDAGYISSVTGDWTGTFDGQEGSWYRDRANHTGTQLAATISNFQTTVSANTDVAANTAARHAAVTVTDSSEIDFTLTGQNITASIITGSIDVLKLDSGVQASLGLADSALQNITGLIDEGSNVTITGTGTSGDPYIINATGGGGGGGTVDTIVAGTGITVDATDPANPIVATTITQYTDELAQDAVGAMVDSTLVYTDGTPLLSRAAISGDITIAGGSNTAAITAGVIVNADINASAAIDATKIADGSVTSTEFQYINTLTSNAQTQIDGKQPQLNGTGFVKASGTTILYDNSTYLTTSAAAVAYQPLDSDLTSWAGVTRASGFDTFVATPSSANLASLVTNETGSGALVFATSPTLVTPDLGTPTSGTLTNTTGFPVANLAGAGTGVLTFLATPSSANLATAVTDETGSGSLVFATSPTLVTPNLGTPSALTLTNATGLPVAGGGTGVASLTAYAPIFGGTTSTGAVQSGTVGTAGQVLTSNGAGALPTFQAAPTGAWTTIKKTADTSRNSTVTPTADPDLTFSMAANTAYRIRLFVAFTCASANPDFLWSMSGPTSPSIFVSTYYSNPYGTSSYTYSGITSSAAFPGNTSVLSNSTGTGILSIDAYVLTGASSGTFSFNWSQNSSTVQDVTVRKGSTMEYLSA